MEPLEDDLEIVRRVKDGDIQSFEVIIKKYQQKILRLCCAMVGGPQAEDAAQEIFIKSYQSLSQFREESSFSTWIYRIASNHCLNIILKKKRSREESLDHLIEKSGERIYSLLSEPALNTSIENKQIVDSILSHLDPEERVILSLREIEGLTYQEIAETMRISVDSVKVRLFRARKSVIRFAKKLNL